MATTVTVDATLVITHISDTESTIVLGLGTKDIALARINESHPGHFVSVGCDTSENFVRWRLPLIAAYLKAMKRRDDCVTVHWEDMNLVKQSATLCRMKGAPIQTYTCDGIVYSEDTLAEIIKLHRISVALTTMIEWRNHGV